MYAYVRRCAGEDVSGSDSELPVSQAMAAKIRERMAFRRMSRQRLADEAKISLSTLEKALNGSRSFTLATVVRLEQALGVALRPPANEGEEPAQAPDDLGAYSQASVKWLEGDYLTLRPSFGAKDSIYAYLTTIGWCAEGSRLTFQESERIDAAFSQKGVVSVPNKSGHIYLQTNEDGQMRLAILGRPLINGSMYGVLTTLLASTGTQLQPVSVPLALVPVKGDVPVFGRIDPGAPCYPQYRDHLKRATADGFARLIGI
jgi:transcriptional regulator with XRE-family HTH domain